MPRSGRKTIDYPILLVNKWQAIYYENEVFIRSKGIGGFQNFMTVILDQLYEKGSVPEWIMALLDHPQPS